MLDCCPVYFGFDCCNHHSTIVLCQFVDSRFNAPLLCTFTDHLSYWIGWGLPASGPTYTPLCAETLRLPFDWGQLTYLCPSPPPKLLQLICTVGCKQPSLLGSPGIGKSMTAADSVSCLRLLIEAPSCLRSEAIVETYSWSPP